ncbi:MAG: amidohydrolase family protein, partial [Candidatus Kerfeldbacteria bacterium]|nr:amidohydrolase family protein [Candidatus Kerfeldbacteria bacterium]
PEQAQLNPERLSSEDKAWQQRVDVAFKQVTCPKRPRTFPAGAYTGPLYDMHVHMASIPDGPPDSPVEPGEGLALGVNTMVEDYLCMMDTEGTEKALVFFPVWEPGTKPMLNVVKRAMETYPDRFIPFIMPPADDGSPDGFPTVAAQELSEMLSVFPGLFRGYGEIGLYARDGGAPELKPDSQRLLDIYPIIRQHKLLVYFHLGQGQKDEFERVLGQNRDITFIFHGDQLIEDAGGGDNLQLIDEILTEHPNVYYGIDELYGDVYLMREGVSKGQFIAHFENPEPLLEKDLKSWEWFINKHPDQVIWDTDRGGSVRWALDPDLAVVLNDYSRAFIGRLDPSVREKFAYKNAKRMVGE